MYRVSVEQIELVDVLPSKNQVLYKLTNYQTY